MLSFIRPRNILPTLKRSLLPPLLQKQQLLHRRRPRRRRQKKKPRNLKGTW
jgi:hypothetical protein